MDNIGVRIWDVGEMFYKCSIGSHNPSVYYTREGYTAWYECTEKAVVMLSTGLEDKNRKEIYTGDIVKVDWAGEEQDEYIVSNKYNEPFVVEFRNYEYAPFSRFLPMPKNIEVIGNIYDNPELLNKLK